MVKKILIGLAVLAVAFVGFIAILIVAYVRLEDRYQKDMDVVRQKDAQQIFKLVQEYTDKTGHLPFQEHTADKPFMVVIGHSSQEEDYFAQDPVLARGGIFANSSTMERLLSKELKRPIRLPRDPQKVATYAPNVYIYFVKGNELAVASHLKNPHENAVEYKWQGGRFYSYTIAYKVGPPKK